jgi:uncharacterized repeat protein (TIGR03803 family)
MSYTSDARLKRLTPRAAPVKEIVMRPSRFVSFMFQLLTVAVVVMFLTTAGPAQTFTDFFNFSGTNGGVPGYNVLVQGRDGQLYGTTNEGGTDGFGVVFRINTGGTESVIYSFDGAHGRAPSGGLTLGSDGNFYGTANIGGTFDLGVLFRVTSSGSLTVLHNFAGTEDAYPDSPPIEASDGNFYGTTQGDTYGEVYKYAPDGTFTALHTFSGSDGRSANAHLIQGADGNLYGTTVEGGTYGWGTVFKMNTSGTITAQYSFDSPTTGAYLYWPVVQASDGNFYSTTSLYAANDYTGSVFRLNEEFSYTLVYTDADNNTQVSELSSGVVQATDRNLYGAGQLGGADQYGGIYQIGLDGASSVVYSFSNPTQMQAGMMQHTNGKLYGSVNYASTDGYGYLYSLDMGLGPFIAFVRPTGGAGQSAQILGKGLTGATSVTFNGVSATSFKVLTDTFMTAVVPGGATSGKVVVTTPSGPLTSNVIFRVNQL